jgi:molybdopterin synthase catalytic subunit
MEKPNILFQLSEEPLSEAQARQDLSNSSCGAIVLFVGTVRDFSKDQPVTFLEFEAYEPMVFVTLEQIAMEIREEFGVSEVLLHHRLGKVGVAETVVIAGVSAPHRASAFKACEELMNRLKKHVPIWKKEHTAHGTVWITPTP